MDLSGEIEFELLESKPVGSDTVVFRLEDGAIVKIRVDIDRAGVAVNYKNPDGSPHYNITVSNKIVIIPPTKRYRLPKEQIQPTQQAKDVKSEPYR
ncbi:MAG: hypothetical protein QXJ86_00910 [Nitrososphaerales archaeon]